MTVYSVELGTLAGTYRAAQQITDNARIRFRGIPLYLDFGISVSRIDRACEIAIQTCADWRNDHDGIRKRYVTHLLSTVRHNASYH